MSRQYQLSTLKVLFAISLIFGIHAHNYLTVPVSRANQASTQTGCRYGGTARNVEGRDIEEAADLDLNLRQAPMCAGPCDRTISAGLRNVGTIQRGQTVRVQWYRHNHPGGFIRLAWSPTSQSDSHASFDQHIQIITCKDIGGCGPANLNDNTGASNGLDCATSIQVPSYLTDGAWTLQWAYFGGYYNAGDYYACVDYTVSGGTAVGTQPAPYYQGGDVTYPNSNVCLFYSTNALHVCTVEPCNNGTFAPGPQKGGALGFGGPTPVTTGIIKATTGKPIPFTTGAVTTKAKAITTKAKITTGAVKTTTTTSTTGVKGTTTTTSSTGSSTGMCYLPGTPNINGPINSNPPTCTGTARCADGQCCSKYGFCGPILSNDGNYYENGQIITADYAFYLYCNSSKADYRKVPCSSGSTSTSTSTSTTGQALPSSTSTTTTTGPSTQPCTTGNMQCASSTTYQTCANSQWGVSQSCGVGLVCSPSGNYIYCVRPTSNIERMASAASDNAASARSMAWTLLVTVTLAVLTLF